MKSVRLELSLHGLEVAPTEVSGMDWLARIFDWLREQEAGFSVMAAILAIGAVLFTAIRFLLPRRPQATPEPAAKTTLEEDPLLALPTGPVVAVLPFENLSRDPDQEYFSDGLTDDIITALSRFKDLFAIARNSTFQYKGQAVDVRLLNKELGARYVLEGSVQRAGDTNIEPCSPSLPRIPSAPQRILYHRKRLNAGVFQHPC